MKKYIVSALLLSATTIHSYEVYLEEIINKTPHDIIFTGREISFPMSVPSVPPTSRPGIKAPSSPLSFPIIIPAQSTKKISHMIVNQEESDSPAEIFFNFKDTNDNTVFLIARRGQLIKFAPMLGWQTKGIKFDIPTGTYHVSFTFEGEDGIADVTIKPSKSVKPPFRNY